MCDLILILSRCEKGIKDEYQFHFKGFYKGVKIKNLLVKTDEHQKFNIQQDYLLWAQKVDLIDGVLQAKIIKSKKIN